MATLLVAHLEVAMFFRRKKSGSRTYLQIVENHWRDGRPKQTGCQAVVTAVLRGRGFEFPVERAVFLTVLHRLLAPGSDRAAEKWKNDYVLRGAGSLRLHHLYRAMGWL